MSKRAKFFKIVNFGCRDKRFLKVDSSGSGVSKKNYCQKCRNAPNFSKLSGLVVETQDFLKVDSSGSGVSKQKITVLFFKFLGSLPSHL